MEILVKNIVIPFTEPSEEAVGKARASTEALLHRKLSGGGRIYKKSIDARNRNAIKFVCTASVDADFTSAEIETLVSAGCEVLCGGELALPNQGTIKLAARPVVVGFGPCGMFCALILAEAGYRPLVLERGGNVSERAESVERFIKTGVLDPKSNVQFGAGGAGTFSDGKLVTRINDPACRYILKRLCGFGAPDDILTAAKPHIGTDRLRSVVAALRDEIINLGGEIVFGCCVSQLIYNAASEVAAVKCELADGAVEVYPCGTLTLATGHSARDIYSSLAADGFSLNTKPFSVGARIEHLRSDIDRALYGNFAGDPRLGAGEYALSKRWNDGSAVYTFCMCPGGEVIAAASEQNGIVVNGMSVRARDGANSNSALVASVDPSPGRPLEAIEFQRKLERAAYESTRADGEYLAPCQTTGDFINGQTGTKPTRIKPTYRGGQVAMRDLNSILPRDVADRMKAGIIDFGNKLRGFDARDALLTGVETRTSAPLRVIRGDDFTAPGRSNVYPCGEGAGYAGGITSAAVDGLHAAEKIIARYRPAD